VSPGRATVSVVGFVPVTGTALLRVGDPPREGVVEFTDERRTVALPIRAALPVLTKAHVRDDLHHSVRLLTSAALLGLRLVAAGRLEPAAGQVPHWRVGPLGREDEDRVRSLVGDGLDDEVTVRAMLDAIADAMPRAAPTPDARRRPAPQASFHERLARRLEPRPDARDLPQLVRISLRVEADEEELVAGSVRLVLQVHDEQDPLHLCDAAVLWTESGPEASHGFGDRARTHAAIALRAAAEAWPVLDRLAELRVPDQITLDTDELVSLLNVGVADLAAFGVDVLWPRSLGRDLTATAVLERASASPSDNPLQTGLFGPDQMFSFQWQVALHGEALTEEEMARLAGAAAPILRLRGSWTVIDPAVARKARKRLIRTVAPGPAVAAALTGTVEVGQGDEAVDEQVVVGATLLDVRERLLGAATRDAVEPPAALAGTLRDYQRQGLSWLVEMTSLGLGACLADDMGLGKTITLIALHLHRAQEGAGQGSGGPTLVVCPASLLGNWEAEIARFAPGVAVRRFHGGGRSLTDVHQGFVLTTYGTMRVSAESLAQVRWGLVVADEAQHVKNARSSTARALRAIPHGSRIAMTGTPVENNLTELWAILDWATPGLLGSRLAFRKRWAAQVEAGVDPAVTRQFTELISPFVLRRRKSDPGIAPELPAKTETDHPLGLTREQVVLYEAFVKDTMQRIERADPADQVTRRGRVLALLTGLKQICNHPAHFLKQSGAVRLSGRSEKLDLIDELLGTVLAEDGAALVFTQYVAMGRLLSAHLTKGGLEHRFLHGGTPIRERESMVASFQAGDFPVFLLSLKAGGTGLNLTSADHVIHVDRWWNPAVEEQATDRAYRIGQTKPVQVHRLVTRGTIEEKIAELLTRKRALADAVLGNGEAALTELSDDELRDLVTLRRDEDRRHGWDG
jgi:superfamily II DNA or RNA helicase